MCPVGFKDGCGPGRAVGFPFSSLGKDVSSAVIPFPRLTVGQRGQEDRTLVLLVYSSPRNLSRGVLSATVPDLKDRILEL